MKEKHFFAGNNTSKGFTSFFDSIFDPIDLNHIYIIKGGPGVGKNQFMKKFAEEMSKKDYTIKYIHCSSDKESLDGIIVKELKLAFVDGTSPHVVEPKIPGAVDEILNLGAFLNNNQLEKHKNQIVQINQAKSRIYKSAYRYLQSANIISEEINSIYDQFINIDKFNKMCDESIEKLFKDNNLQKTSKIKIAFSEAYTADGYINMTKPLCQDKTVWTVIGEDSNYTSEFLSRIKDAAVRKGYDLELYMTPLNPEKFQHIFIPELNTFIVSSENYVGNDFEEAFDIHSIMDTDNLKAYITEIENNIQLYNLMIKYALEKLTETKKYHELLEVFYINSMDFNAVDEVFNNILKEYIKF